MDPASRNPTPAQSPCPTPCTTPPPGSQRSDIWNYIWTHIRKCEFENQKQQYLPRPAFEKVTHPDVIRSVVFQDLPARSDDQNTARLVGQIQSEGRKLFAACLYSGLPFDFLGALFSKGLRDLDLPLKSKDCPDNRYRQMFENSFLQNQYLFDVPFFEEFSFKDLKPGAPIPINFREALQYRRGSGTFGTVYEITIDEDQFSFSYERRNGNRFAMKVINHEASTKRERNFIDATKSIRHDHCAQCFASWMRGRKYYMVFELADCNLHEFMEKHPAGMTHREITSAWLFKQMRGIAAALKEFHHIEQVIDDNTLRANDALPKPRTGYLHDIKPENILVFYANQNCLRLCDWSCAKVADFIASVSGQKLQSAQTVNHGTLTYKPPESHGRGKTSRPYDLWSLGCVLLELLIWYRLGWKELEIFREERLGKEDLRVTGIKDDKYYYVDKEGRMHVRISVLQRIDQLKDLLDGELKEVLDVIPDLLQVDSQKRLDTISLLDRLERVKTSTQVVSVSPRLASDGDANMLVSGPQIKVETYEG